MYHCLRYNDDVFLMKDCPMLTEDGHCFYCPYFQSDEPLIPTSDETMKRVLEKLNEISNLILKKVKEGNNAGI